MQQDSDNKPQVPPTEEQPERHVPSAEEIDAAYEQFGEEAALELQKEVVFKAAVHDFMAALNKKHNQKRQQQEQDKQDDKKE